MKFKVGDRIEGAPTARYRRRRPGKIVGTRTHAEGHDEYAVQFDGTYAPAYFTVTNIDCWYELATETSPMSYPPANLKDFPLHAGCLAYFPAALHLVAHLSKKGNDKHNPGEPLHHARDKSGDEGDALLRHQANVGTIDTESELDHAVAVAWRALAQLQKLAESRYGWPKAPGAK